MTFFSKQELNYQIKDDSVPTTSVIEPLTTEVPLEEQQQPVDLASDVEGKSECIITENITSVDPLNLEPVGRIEKPGFDFDISRKYPTDRGHFPETIKDAALKREILKHGPCRPSGPYEYTDSSGNIVINFSARYYHQFVENIEVPRGWLCYSIEMKKPYCEVCWLFADRSKQNHDQRVWINGVSGSTHNVLEKIRRHEKSSIHIEASAVYVRWKSGKNLDEENEREIRRQSCFWVKVLERIVSIILTLATLTLAFRGHREEVFDGTCEGGNFLGLVALLAQYDEVLSEVIALPARATKYLSAKIQNELIGLLGKAVTSSLVEKINAAPFWSVILDSTSDITRVDQLSVVVRWVQVKDEECTVIESFLGFVKIVDSKAEGIASTAKNFLEGIGLSFSQIRGQGYDGANVMSGIHAGVQRLIKDMVDNPVPFVHCGCHNLNLVIKDSVDSVSDNENFFAILREVFSFFGSSLNRWAELRFHSNPGSLTLKKLCVTRWTSRIDSVRAVRDRYPHIMRVLTNLSLTSKNKKERDDANCLKKKIDSFEFILFIVIWERILRAINAASRELQSPNLDLSVASRMLNCSVSELRILRNSWESIKETASALASSWDTALDFKPARTKRAVNVVDEDDTI